MWGSDQDADDSRAEGYDRGYNEGLEDGRREVGRDHEILVDKWEQTVIRSSPLYAAALSLCKILRDGDQVVPNSLVHQRVEVAMAELSALEGGEDGR